MSANLPTSSTLHLDDCSDNWDVIVCSRDLQLTFSLRTNRDLEFAAAFPV
jgi:hypothetical protein